METVRAYEAKTHLPKLTERVIKGEHITITKHGVPVAVLQPPDPEKTVNTKSVMAERKKRLREADSVRFITLLSQLPIIVEYEQTERIMKDLLTLARAHKLLSHDAYYLDLNNIRITFDSMLKKDEVNLKNIFKNNHNMSEVLRNNKVIMELKYNNFIPLWIKRILQIPRFERCAISKYSLSRYLEM